MSIAMMKPSHAWSIRAPYLIAALACSLFVGGSIARDQSQVREFRKTHPCPATGKTAGACPGYVVDHILPLCAGAPDKPGNMQWQALAESRIKDKREIAYCVCIKHNRNNCLTP